MAFLKSGFSNGSSNCLPESHWLNLWVFFPSKSSSNCLPEQMQSHIVCIWTICHLMEFSDDSSNRLPEQMQSRIGCICTPFLMSEFSNVSSNCLPVHMHWLHFQMCPQIGCLYVYIGYIWTIFPLREFSDVFLNRLPEQMQSRIDCIFRPFHMREF